MYIFAYNFNFYAMNDTAIEWFFIQLTEIDYGCINKTFLQNDNTLAGHKLRELFKQAKEIENIEKLKRQLFIGKVSEIIGMDKTIELWKECIETFK